MKNLKDYVCCINEDWLNNAGNNNSNTNTKLSASAERALQNTQKKAGNKWDDVKEKFTKALTMVDNILVGDLKNTTNEAVKTTGANLDALEQKVTDLVMSLSEDSGNVGKLVNGYLDDTNKGLDNMKGVVAFLLGSLSAGSKGMKSPELINVLNIVAKA